MRILIDLKPVDPDLSIPIHYNHLIQSAIYAALPEEMADFLHDRGFSRGSRVYKMFGFSQLQGRYELDKAKKTIAFPMGARLVITSPNEEFLFALANRLLQLGEIRIGPGIFQTDHIAFAKDWIEETRIQVKALSPIVAYSTMTKPDGSPYTCYFAPGEKEFTRLISDNLCRKYEAYYRKSPPEGGLTLKPLNRPHLHITRFKGTVIKGYTGSFVLEGAPELLQLALDSSIGAKGSQGYGVLELIKRS